MSRLRSLLCVLLSCTVACNAAVLTGAPPAQIPPRLPPPVTVVIEPFFDSSEWKVETQLQQATVLAPAGTTIGMSTGAPYGPGGYGSPYGAYGSPYGAYGAYPTDVTVATTVAVKSIFNRVDILALEHAQVLSAVARLRPAWQVQTTSGLKSLDGPVTLVRVVVGESTVVESDRTYKTVAFGFGIIIWPLLLLQIGGVDETRRVYGQLDRYDADALQLRPRLVRYPTQPDFAVDTRGLPPTVQPFGLDLAYNEGVAASSTSRDTTLVEGFVQRLAVAIVALVEGVRPEVAAPAGGHGR